MRKKGNIESTVCFHDVEVPALGVFLLVLNKSGLFAEASAASYDCEV